MCFSCSLTSTQEKELCATTALSSSLVFPEEDRAARREVEAAIRETSSVRPEAQGYGLVYICVSFQAHTVPVTAH